MELISYIFPSLYLQLWNVQALGIIYQERSVFKYMWYGTYTGTQHRPALALGIVIYMHPYQWYSYVQASVPQVRLYTV
jgi:hypothetical protein